MMKNMKMKTKLILGFMIPIVITVLNMLISNLSTRRAARITDPAYQERYAMISSIVSFAFALVSVIITVWIALMLIKIIEKSVVQLSNAAKEIALGHVNIEMVKYNNDEFGDLVDEYRAVIDNIKYQAQIAEEVSRGNLTIKVNPKSSEDLLGNSLKQLVEDNFHILTTLDFIFAKANLSRSYHGSEPIFNDKGIIFLKDARHPLLNPKTVVPSNIHLGDDFYLLIVTGPNTGGKTVSLKTVGLLTLMGQAGLHIPAFEGSKLAVFEEVYADIGDEQSIEQNLSTFSSHMTNTVSILEKADDRSLVLFDELGAGTDPTEGAALATSILSFLRNMQVRTMATTHYSELKVYALSTEGVENACCEFDVETLRPTYRLLIGIPGKSNAFAISSKLGLPEFIIEDAKKRITEQDVAFEDLLSDLETSRVTIEKEQQEIAAYRAEIEQLKKQTLEKQKQLEERKERMIREANEEARKILQEAKDYADETIRKFNKGMSGKDMENTRGLLREKITAANEKLSYKAQKPSQKQNKPEDFHLGDAVKVLSLGLNGTITSLPNARGDLYVQMGILRSQVNIKDIEKIDEEVITGPNIQRTSSGKIRMSKTSTISPEINLIGKTVDEALSTMDKYLDDAYLAHLNQVRVVHGKGTGALRQAVHKHLKKLKIVKSFRLGEFGEGDAGVTIVEFK